MANEKALSNETIIAAIIQSNTYKDAADKLGISIRTIYDRMHDKDFKMQYTDAKAQVLRTAVNSVNSHLSEAIEVIAGIMNNAENNPAVRMQAAQTMINTSIKLKGHIEGAECNFKNGF